jgi:hypothetical protein
MGRAAEAMAQYRQALALAPDRVEALTNLGDLLRRDGALDEAAALERRAVGLRPADPALQGRLGLTLHERHDFAAATDCFRRAAALAPEDASAHMDLAMALLTAGDIAGGAAEYEWRWCGINRARMPPLCAPLWDGSPLDGTLLLWSEQGLGDTIQFVRYAAMVRPRVKRLLLAVPPTLASLVATAPGLDGVLRFDEKLPPIDAYLPLMSAMERLGTTRATIPAPVRYLAADATRRARFVPLIGAAPCRVGLVWGDNQRHDNDRRRSLPPELLRGLVAEPGFRFFALQLGADIAPLGGGVIDLAPYLADFADTAAAMAELDVVVSVDTAAAHLPGALGRPCFLLLSHCADWRWLVDRGDTPWYPSLRLFRQPRLGAWEPALAALAAALRRFGDDITSRVPAAPLPAARSAAAAGFPPAAPAAPRVAAPPAASPALPPRLVAR